MEQLGALGALADAFDLNDSLLSDDPPQAVGARVDWVMHANAEGNGRMTLATFGSTGIPRPCARRCRLAIQSRIPGDAVQWKTPGGCDGICTSSVCDDLGRFVTDALGAPVVMHTIGAPLRLTTMDFTLISYAPDMVARSYPSSARRDIS
jgi:hypothetical protein